VTSNSNGELQQSFESMDEETTTIGLCGAPKGLGSSSERLYGLSKGSSFDSSKGFLF
jgi:hypothetical protein